MDQMVDMVWHDDGHVVHLSLHRADLVVETVLCPNGPDGVCQHDTVGCVVDWFISRFGLDCHVGIAPPAPTMAIAWSWVGDRRDLDLAQVWVVSTADDFYQSWAAVNRP